MSLTQPSSPERAGARVIRAEDPPVGTTLAERTAAIIRERIMAKSSRFLPGTRLLPHEVAAELGVSATPVREAFKLLAADGLVSFSPRRGTRVVSLTRAELQDLLAVRAGLELLSIRFREEPYAKQELARMARHLSDCDRAIGSRDKKEYFRHDTAFHRLVVEASGSQRLLGLWDLTYQQSQVLEAYFPDNWPAIRTALGEHKQLLETLRNGDMAERLALLEDHWARTGDRLGDVFEYLDRVGHATAAR